MDGDGARQAPTPSMNPQAQSHEALKAMTDAADPGRSQAIADDWAELAAGFDEAAGLLQRAAAGSAGGWSGDAAEGMRSALAQIAEWSEGTGARYQAASTAIADQCGAADSAKSSMPPPVPYDPGQMIRDARESGNIFEMATLPHRMYAQKQKHDAAHEQAAEIVASRDTSFAAAVAAVPAFVPPPSLTVEVPSKAVESTEKPPPPPPVVVPPPAGPPSQGTSAAGFTSAPGGPGVGYGGPGFGAGAPAPTTAPTTGPLPGFGPGGGFRPGDPPQAVIPRAAGARDPAVGLPTAVEGGGQKRPEYLVESDIDGMFGSDEMTSPPVIGEG